MPGTLRGSVLKRYRGATGGWGRNDQKVRCVKQGDLSGGETLTGVRVAIVAMKRLNRRGAKGSRKVDAK